MATRPETNPIKLLHAAQNARAAVAISIARGTADRLARALGVESDASEEIIRRRLKTLGIKNVFFDDGMRGAQTAAEAAALTSRMRAGEPLPLLMSSCPRWCEQSGLKEAGLDALFAPVPPDTRCRGLAVRSLIAAQCGVPFSSIIHVTVVGCAAQKERYNRFRAVAGTYLGEDYVITVRELLLGLAANLTIVGAGSAAPLSSAAPLGSAAPFGGTPTGRSVSSGSGALDGSRSAPTRTSDCTDENRGRLRAVLMLTAQQSGCDIDASAIALTPAAGRCCLLEGQLALPGRSVRYAQLLGLHDAPWLVEQLRRGELRYDLLEVFTCVHCG